VQKYSYFSALSTPNFYVSSAPHGGSFPLSTLLYCLELDKHHSVSLQPHQGFVPACLGLFALEHFDCIRNPVGTTCEQHLIAWPRGPELSLREECAGRGPVCIVDMSCLPGRACSFKLKKQCPTPATSALHRLAQSPGPPHHLHSPVIKLGFHQQRTEGEKKKKLQHKYCRLFVPIAGSALF